MAETKFFVYGLFDSEKPDVIRYVGAASIPKRPEQHATEAVKHPERKTHKLNWIRSVGTIGWRVLQECGSWNETMEAEKALVAEWRTSIGRKLTNATGGGEGFYLPSPEVRARNIAARRAALARPEVRAKLRAAHLGKLLSLEVRAKIRAKLLGRPLSAETRAKMSAARRGKRGPPKSEETRRKIAAANSGKTHAYVASEETKQKLREAWARKKARGYTVSDETRRRQSTAAIGKVPSLGTCRKISEAKMGHAVSEEARRKIGDAHRGRKQAPEHVEKMRAALRESWVRRANVQAASV